MMAEYSRNDLKQIENTSDEDIEDETICERLWGLTEMFPETVRNGTHKLTQLSLKGITKAYKFSRSTLWICGTSFVVLALPVLFEIERVQTEEAALMQQRQILLGPGSGAGQQPLQPRR
ncbi:mitochondrial import receptor subunit TOM22 homolog [Hydra vulgaris]|nr:mitochondrial import receptor subunit TOM22 homolog isoform X1 [Hydra vulgaris]